VHFASTLIVVVDETRPGNITKVEIKR